MKTSVYIVPAMSDRPGSCRIVAKNAEVKSPRADYRSNPGAWKEIGLLNALGRLVSLDADSVDIVDELKSAEPLSAGMFFKVDDVQVATC